MFARKEIDPVKAKFLFSPSDVGENVFLLGIDFEGEPRESRHTTLAEAISIAYQCSVKDANGPPWIRWEIWGNVLSENSDWKAVVISD